MITVIAYRDGVLAADQLVASEQYDLVTGLAAKIFRSEDGKALYGFSGKLSDGGRFKRWILDIDTTPPTFEDFAAILISPDGKVSLASGKHPCFVEVAAPYFAIGSGRELALGAMWKGATAPEAVTCAIELNIACGGPVDVLSLEPTPKGEMEPFKTDWRRSFG